MSHSAAARESERAYHEDLYANNELFRPGSWLAASAAYAIASFGYLPPVSGTRVLDLGVGVGRHAIPAAQYFGPGSQVVGVDMLESAIDKLRRNATRFGIGNIVGVQADVETYDFTAGLPYDLVLSISCVEHVSSKKALERVLCRLQMATRPGGVHCFMLMTDNVWTDPGGVMSIPPLLEQNLSSEETIELLRRLYRGWTIHNLSTKPRQTVQPVGQSEMVLRSTCVQFTAQKFA